jgi:hypothetical protein
LWNILGLCFVRKLICNINAVSNADGNTAVDIYQEHNNQAMVDWLKERGGLSSDDLPRDEDGNLIE